MYAEQSTRMGQGGACPRPGGRRALSSWGRLSAGVLLGRKKPTALFLRPVMNTFARGALYAGLFHFFMLLTGWVK